MPTVEQIRAARALLDWSQSDLAQQAGLSQTGIARIENGTNQPNSQTLHKIQSAFENADIEFLGDSGLRRNSNEVKIFRGTDGFREFMDDVYKSARDKGGEFCLFNARPENWVKWLGHEWFKMHSDRMAALGNRINFKITAQEGETDLISNAFAEYRWFPKELFNDQSFYIYTNKIAFVNFTEEDVSVNVLQNKFFAEGLKVLFNIAWDRVAISLSKN